MSKASATAERLLTAEMIREHAARSQPPQPYERSNEALKHFRDLLELGFLPPVFQQNLDLEPDPLLIRKVTHGRGEELRFDQGVPPVAFSWSQMLLATGQQFEHAVGVGAVAVQMFVRRNSYDHHRGHSFVKQHGKQPVHRPPIWDFWSSGLTALASYCIRDGGRREALRSCRLRTCPMP